MKSGILHRWQDKFGLQESENIVQWLENSDGKDERSKRPEWNIDEKGKGRDNKEEMKKNGRIEERGIKML